MVRDVFLRQYRAAPRVDGDHGIHSSPGDRHRKIVHHSAVHAGTAVDIPRWIKAGQGARRVHRVRDINVLQSGQSPHNLGSALEINGVHQKSRRKLAELSLRCDRRADLAQRFLQIDRGQMQTVQHHSEPVETEQVAFFQRARSLSHLVNGHSAGSGRRDQSADAGSGVHGWDNVSLGKRPHDAHVGKSLEPAAPKH